MKKHRSVICMRKLKLNDVYEKFKSNRKSKTDLADQTWKYALINELFPMKPHQTRRESNNKVKHIDICIRKYLSSTQRMNE